MNQFFRDAIFQDNTAQLNMRLPPAMKAVLSKLARQRTTDATTLARIWLRGTAGTRTKSKLKLRCLKDVPKLLLVEEAERWRRS